MDLGFVRPEPLILSLTLNLPCLLLGFLRIAKELVVASVCFPFASDRGNIEAGTPQDNPPAKNSPGIFPNQRLDRCV